MVLIIVVVFSFLSKILILLGALIRALPKYSHGLGVGVRMVEEGLPNVGIIFGSGLISWKAVKAIGTFCYCRMVNLVPKE